MNPLKIVLISIVPLVLLGGPALPVRQESYSNTDRRYRQLNSRHVYPRWLNPVLVDGYLYPASQMPQAPRHYTDYSPPTYSSPVPAYPSNVLSQLSAGLSWGGDTAAAGVGTATVDFPRPDERTLSISVDSRGVAHIAGVNPTSAIGPGQTYGIYYYNNRYDTRRANGFSAPALLSTTFMSMPSIAASPVNDGVYVVYINAGSLVSRYLNPSTGIWAAESVIAAANGTTTYSMPSAKVSQSGALHVVCRRDDVPAAGTYSLSLQHFQSGVATQVPGTLYQSVTREGWIPDFRFVLVDDQATVVWQYRTPDAELNLDGNPNDIEVYERRGGIEASILGAAATAVGNNLADARIRAWQEVPDVFHGPGPTFTPHFVWVQGRVPAAPVNIDDTRTLDMVPPVVYYQTYPQAVESLYSEVAGDLPFFVFVNELDNANSAIFGLTRHIGPRVVCDARNQAHVFTGEAVHRVGTDWMGRYIRQSVRVPNGIGGYMWIRMSPIAFDVLTTYFPGSMELVEFGTDMGDQLEVVVDVNQQMHITDSAQYTRTMDPELGIRDPNALVGVLPGASVNVSNGNLHHELPLFATKGAGLNQEVRLIYNSREFGSGLLSQGWKLNYEVSLIDHWRSVNAPGTDPWRHTDALTLVLPDGRYINFRYAVFGTGATDRYLVTGNNFDPTNGLIAKMERTQTMVTSPTQLSAWSTEYVMTLKNGVTYTFNDRGKLRLITEPGGDTIVLNHTNGLLTSIADKGNQRTTTLQYENNSSNLNRMARLVRVTDPMSNQYELDYGGGPSGIEPDRHLVEVQFTGEATTPAWTYEYGSMTSNYDRLYFLKKVSTPKGTANGSYGWTLRYSPDGRVLAVTDPADSLRSLEINPTDPALEGIPQVRFYYNDWLTLSSNPMTDPFYETVVTNRRGHRTRYISDPRRALVFEIWDDDFLAGWSPGTTYTDPTVPQGFSARKFGYDYESRLVESTDRWGIRNTYTFDPSTQAGHQHVIDRVDQVRRWQGASSPQLIGDYSYTTDGLHQVQSFAGPEITTGLWPGVMLGSRVVTYGYYAVNGANGRRGQLMSVTYPDCAPPQGTTTINHVVQYQYQGPFGALSRITDEEGRATVFSDFNSLNGLPGSKQSPGCTQTEDFEYDTMGNLLRQRLPQGGQANSPTDWTEYEYNGLYQLVEVSLPAVTSLENSNSSDINSHRTTTCVYDLDGNQTSVTPPAGAASTTSYNRMGQATGGTGPDGNWSQTVDANGNVRTVTDIRGFDSSRIYDSLDRLIQTRRPGGSTGGGGGGPELVTVNVYDGYGGGIHFTDVVHGGPLLSYVSEAGPVRRIRTEYDAWSRPNVVIGPDAYTRSVSYYDESDNTWAVESYGPEVVSGSTTSAFQRLSFSYRDERGRVIASRVSGRPMVGTQSENDTSTSLTWYDRSGRVTRTRDNSGAETAFELDSAGRVQYVRDALNVIVEERVYGDDGFLIETKTPDPVTKSATRVTARKMAYTTRKELWKDLNAADKGSRFEYGRLPGQAVTVTNASSVVTRTTYYDQTQRVDEVIEAYQTSSERKTKNVWTNGLLTETRVFNPTTGQYNASHYKDYDQAGRLERVREPQRDDRVLAYNAFGDLVTDNQGILVTTHTVDDRGLATTSTIVRNETVSTPINRIFNGSGMMTSISNPTLTVLTSYAEPGFTGSGNAAWRGNLRQQTFRVGSETWKVQSHFYDASELETSMADAEVGVVNGQQAANHSWNRDTNGRVTGLRFEDTLVMSIDLAPGGQVSERTRYNASGSAIARTTLTYDGLGRKAGEQTWRVGSNQVLSHIAWEYDDLDRIVAKELRHLGVRQEFQYNALGELTRDQSAGNSGWGGGQNPAAGLHGTSFTNQIGAQGTGNESDPSGEGEIVSASGSQLVSPMSVPAWDRVYAYDAGGNRTSETIDGVSVTYTYGSGSRLQQLTRGSVTVTYTYDGLGNLTSRVTTQTGQATITEEFGYDHLNRMSEYTNSATDAAWTYSHWPTGDRYEKRNVDTGAATLFVSRAGDVSAEYSQANSEAEPDFENRYVQDLGIDSKVARIPDTGGRRHFVADQVGTTSLTLEDDGSREEECVRDAYGNSIAGDTNDERFGFAQREHDTESGFVYMRHRMYDPRIGRFTQMDPLLGNRPFEHYVYAGNNPISFNDPMGEDITPAQWSAYRRGWEELFRAQKAGDDAAYRVAYVKWGQVIKNILDCQDGKDHIDGDAAKAQEWYKKWLETPMYLPGSSGPNEAERNALDAIQEGGSNAITIQTRSLQRGRTAVTITAIGGIGIGSGGLGLKALLAIRAAQLTQAAAAAAVVAPAAVPATQRAIQFSRSPMVQQELNAMAQQWQAAGAAHHQSVVNSGHLLNMARSVNLPTPSPQTADMVLNSATKWLGTYREIANGVFRSLDGLRQFRMTNSCLDGAHDGIPSHVVFEVLNAVGRTMTRLHILLK